MKHNSLEKKTRFSLTLLFSAIIFLFFLVTMAIIGLAVVGMIRHGLFTPGSSLHEMRLLMLQLVCASVLLGSLLATLAARFPLRPVNSAVNAMNRLAAGEYETRLQMDGILRKHPVSREFTESFNHLAEELGQTEMLRSDFINNFSHEFKTPIVSIAGFAKLLEKGNLSEEQKKEYLAIIEEEALRLSDMANNVLNLTKVENQSILTNVSGFNLSELRSSVLLLERKWSRKELEPELDFGEYTIYGNEELLKQVWINLLDNAIKYADQGSTFRIAVTEMPEHFLISVTDSGPDIPKEKTERIFRKFYQADESHGSEGNGIGLAVVKEIVRLHRGDVTVTSANHKTVFTVALPKTAEP